MAIETRPPVGTPTLAAASARRTNRAGHWGLRSSLIALAAFMALTAVGGAIFVVPTMPRSVLHAGVLALFPDFTIPALALGILCGGGALVALIALLVRPQLGALAAVVAGLFMVIFELVEIAVVGFTPLQTPDQWPAWLQVLYLLVGAALVLLGVRLWKAETGTHRLR